MSPFFIGNLSRLFSVIWTQLIPSRRCYLRHPDTLITRPLEVLAISLLQEPRCQGPQLSKTSIWLVGPETKVSQPAFGHR